MTEDKDEREVERDEEEDQELIEGYGEQAKTRLETSTEFGEFLVTPTKAMKKSVYAKFVQKDMAVSNLPKGDTWVFFLMKYQQLIDNLIFLSLDGERTIHDKVKGTSYTVPKFNPIIEVATVYDSEKLSFLGLLRSVGGFERKELSTVHHDIRKNRPEDQQGWFNKNKGNQ